MEQVLSSINYCYLNCQSTDDRQIQVQMFTLDFAEPVQSWFIEQICNQCKKKEKLLYKD